MILLFLQPREIDNKIDVKGTMINKGQEDKDTFSNKGGDREREVNQDQETVQEREVTSNLIKRRIRGNRVPTREIEKRKVVNINLNLQADSV